MADEFAIVNTVADTGGGTQDITSGDITDFAGAIFITSCTTVADTGAAHARMSYGFCDASGNGYCSSWRSQDDHASLPLAITWNSTTRCIVFAHESATGSTAPTLRGTASAVPRSTSGLANGIRISWDDTPIEAWRITVILFGGVTNLAVFQEGVPTTPGTFDVGFEPDVVLFHSNKGNYGSPTGATIDADHGIGYVINDGSDTQAHMMYEWNSAGEPSSAGAYISTVEGVGEINGSAENHAPLSLFTSSGFTWDAETSAIPCHFMCIEFSEPGRSFGLALETLPSSTGDHAFTGLGFQPAIVIGMAMPLTSVDSVVTSNQAGASADFAFTSTVEVCHSVHSEIDLTVPAGGNSNANSRSNVQALWMYGHEGTTFVDADFSSMDASGFTLNFTTATAGRMLVFGISNGAIVSATDETVQISEEVLLVGTNLSLVPETVQVSEGILLILTTFIRIAETVQVSEGIVTAISSAAISPPRLHGTTFSPGAVRGTTL